MKTNMKYYNKSGLLLGWKTVKKNVGINVGINVGLNVGLKMEKVVLMMQCTTE